jgi:hypothetical protein
MILFFLLPEIFNLLGLHPSFTLGLPEVPDGQIQSYDPIVFMHCPKHGGGSGCVHSSTSITSSTMSKQVITN